MICGVLLAGGRGQRFGGDKLSAKLPDGTPLALAAARSLAAGVDRCVLVTRPGRGWLVDALTGPRWLPVITATAEEGMGASLRAGITASADASGWVVALADMPAIAPATICAVAQSLRDGAAIGVPECRGQRGHPVGFSAVLRPHLLALAGDVGARGIVASAGDSARLIPVPDPGITLDVDRPADLKRIAAPYRQTRVAGANNDLTV